MTVVGEEAWPVCGAHQSECGVSVSLHDYSGQQTGHQQGQGEGLAEQVKKE